MTARFHLTFGLFGICWRLLFRSSKCCDCVSAQSEDSEEILIGRLCLDTKLNWDSLSDMATDQFKVWLI